MYVRWTVLSLKFNPLAKLFFKQKQKKPKVHEKGPLPPEETVQVRHATYHINPGKTVVKMLSWTES